MTGHGVERKTESWIQTFLLNKRVWDHRLPQWLSGKESTCNAGVEGGTGWIPGSGRSPRGGHGNPLQNSCIQNPMDRGAWWAIQSIELHSQARLKQLSMYARSYKSRYSLKGTEMVHP